MNRTQKPAETLCRSATSWSPWMVSAIRLVFILVSMSVTAQGQLTITNPNSVDQVHAKSSVHLNHRSNASVVTASHNHGIQIHVTTIKLMVDEETRNSIYRNVGAPGFSIQTSVDPLPPIELTGESSSTMKIATIGNAIQSTVAIRSPTTCAMAVVDRSVSDQILSQIGQADPTSIKRSPAMMLINGNVAEMNDVVERPYVIGFDASTASGTVETFEEGMKIRMLAVSEKESMRFTAQINSSAITSVKQIKLPQSSEKTALDQTPVIQVPVQQTQSVNVSATLSANQCLLIDPFITATLTTTQQSPTPMLGKIPYIGKSFSSETAVQVDRHVLLFMLPSTVGE
ncbi:hypothetical protein [Rubripirellula obstinata]|nr:hypothetical protein [Rubripirellula obstinata]